MMLKRIFTITVIVFSMLFVQGCNNDDVSNKARVQLKLIDLPGDYLQVNVNIVDVQYNNVSHRSAGCKNYTFLRNLFSAHMPEEGRQDITFL